MSEHAIVKTPAGALRGTVEDGLHVFRGVPYAAPPVGELRWRATQPHPGWEGTRDATRHGPVCPQPVDVPWNALQGTRGRDRRRLDEDCLTLTISAPAAPGAARPVVVYIHGGGNVIGAGSWDVFSAARLARHGDVVAVGVNYRFGPFGYLFTDEDGAGRGNWWLEDQLAALRWIQDNIAAFGGDPASVTAMGHSGGAASIATILGLPESRGLVSRAILMGLPLGFAARSAPDARAATARYLELLGVASVEEARAVPAGALVEAEAALTQELSGWNLWCPGFCNVVDGHRLKRQPLAALAAGDGAEVDVLVGWTREEYAMSCLTDPSMRTISRERAIERAQLTFGDAAEAAYDDYARSRPGALPVQVLIDILSDERYRMGALDLLEIFEDRGRPGFAYQFDWQTKVMDGLLGAPHCLEIPFALDALDAWDDGEMLAGTDTPQRQGLADTMHRAWIGFIRDGDPQHEQLPSWPRYRAETGTVMRFDAVTQPVADLVGPWRRAWTRHGGTQR